MKSTTARFRAALAAALLSAAGAVVSPAPASAADPHPESDMRPEDRTCYWEALPVAIIAPLLFIGIGCLWNAIDRKRKIHPSPSAHP